MANDATWRNVAPTSCRDDHCGSCDVAFLGDESPCVECSSLEACSSAYIWFHYSCVGLDEANAPDSLTNWYCPECRLNPNDSEQKKIPPPPLRKVESVTPPSPPASRPLLLSLDGRTVYSSKLACLFSVGNQLAPRYFAGLSDAIITGYEESEKLWFDRLASAKAAAAGTIIS